MKIILAIIATMIGVVAFYFYTRDIVRGRTRPHTYTWLIWAMTQGISVAGMWYGGGGWGVLNLFCGWLFVCGVLVLSLAYGTRDITMSDTVMLVAALVAIYVWCGLKNPLLAVCVATGIDLVGYVPTFRKSYEDPWSESAGTWMAFAVSGGIAIAALNAYTFLTLTYSVSIACANLALAIMCVVRQRRHT